MSGTIKYKIFDSEIKEFDEKNLIVDHFISTERRDRGDEVMLADGMKIKGRPVVLLQHGRTALGSEPIAKPVWIKKGTYKNKKGILAKTKFFDDEQGLGRRLWQKTKDGYMPNWSIGYMILDWSQKRDYREIKEWDLLEYSLVGVPMNPDAQTIYSKEYDDLETVYEDIEAAISENDKDQDLLPFRFYIIPEEDSEDEKEFGEKPYENEHACHLVSKDWDRVRRENNKFGQGIHAIWGIKNDTAQLSSIHFDAKRFTAGEARKWCKDHDHKCDPFEPAKQKLSLDIQEKGVIPYNKTPLASEGTAWDAAAEVEKAEVSDLKIMCVFFEGDGENKTQYKGPHHKTGGDHACVWAGVRALAAVIMGARGGMNVPDAAMAGIKRHVAGHYKDFDKGEPPWEKDFLTTKEVEGLFNSLPSDNLEKGYKSDFDLESYKLQLMDSVIETMKKEGLFGKATDDPASDGKDKANKGHGDNPRMRLVIKQNDNQQQRQENAKALAELIANAVGKAFRQGIRKLLGRVD